jgi:hypothetical protein
VVRWHKNYSYMYLNSNFPGADAIYDAAIENEPIGPAVPSDWLESVLPVGTGSATRVFFAETIHKQVFQEGNYWNGKESCTTKQGQFLQHIEFQSQSIGQVFGLAHHEHHSEAAVTCFSQLNDESYQDPAHALDTTMLTVENLMDDDDSDFNIPFNDEGADRSFDASVTRAGEPATERVVPANDQVEVVQIEFTKFSALPDEERKNVVPKGGSAYSSLQPAFDKLSRLVTNAESFYVLSQLLEGVETEMMARAGDTTSHARKVTDTVAGVVSTLEIDNRRKDIRQRPFYEK